VEVEDGGWRIEVVLREGEAMGKIAATKFKRMEAI